MGVDMFWALNMPSVGSVGRPWPFLIFPPPYPMVAIHKRGEREAKDEHQWANLHGGR